MLYPDHVWPPQQILPIFGKYLQSKGWTWGLQRDDLGWAAVSISATVVLRTRVSVAGFSSSWDQGEFKVQLWRPEFASTIAWRRNQGYRDVAVKILDRISAQEFANPVMRKVPFTGHLEKSVMEETMRWFPEQVRRWVARTIPTANQIDFLFDQDRRGVLFEDEGAADDA